MFMLEAIVSVRTKVNKVGKKFGNWSWDGLGDILVQDLTTTIKQTPKFFKYLTGWNVHVICSNERKDIWEELSKTSPYGGPTVTPKNFLKEYMLSIVAGDRNEISAQQFLKNSKKLFKSYAEEAVGIAYKAGHLLFDYTILSDIPTVHPLITGVFMYMSLYYRRTFMRFGKKRQAEKAEDKAWEDISENERKERWNTYTRGKSGGTSYEDFCRMEEEMRDAFEAGPDEFFRKVFGDEFSDYFRHAHEYTNSQDSRRYDHDTHSRPGRFAVKKRQYKDGCPYDLLGVERGIGEKALRKAFRAKAFEVHPDRHEGDEVMEQRFKNLTNAYQDIQTGW